MNRIHVMEVSDRWLRVFVSAADAGSFTVAATRLGVGQPAVSHAIKHLESTLKLQLFERHSGTIVLTPEGRQLARRIGGGFELIDAAVAEVAATALRSKAVTVSVSTALATYWLMPRLADFKSRHPEIELRVVTQDTDEGVGRDRADLWVPLGHGPWPALRRWHFAEEQIVAVCSPSYRGLVGPEASIAEAALLHNEERYRARYDWKKWFEKHGLDPHPALSGQRSNDYSIVVNAALQGQGVALGWLHIVGPLLDSGQLVPFDVGQSAVMTNHPFEVVERRDQSRIAVETFRDWLVRQASGPATTTRFETSTAESDQPVQHRSH